jgi:hypothetical protein
VAKHKNFFLFETHPGRVQSIFELCPGRYSPFILSGDLEQALKYGGRAKGLDEGAEGRQGGG